MEILHLTLKKQWFDMIFHGVKKEEYREIKPYWSNRLFDKGQLKQFDIIRFRNGYSKDAPWMDIKYKGVRLDYGQPDWGAIIGEVYYCIQLGGILNYGNVSDDQG